MRSNEFFKIPNDVFKYKLSGTELMVLAAMHSLRCVVYDNKKYVSISQKALSTITGLTPKTISRIIDKLNTYGLILEVRRYFVDKHKLGRYHYVLPVIRGKYFFVSRRIFKRKLTSAQFRMYLFFCKCAESRSRQFWNSYNDISENLKIKRSSVIKTVSELLKMGIISRFKVIKADGSFADNYYQINTIILKRPKIRKKRRCRISAHDIFNSIAKQFKHNTIVNPLRLFVKYSFNVFFIARGSPKIYISVSSTHLDTHRRKNNIKLYLKYRCNLQLYNRKKDKTKKGYCLFISPECHND